MHVINKNHACYNIMHYLALFFATSKRHALVDNCIWQVHRESNTESRIASGLWRSCRFKLISWMLSLITILFQRIYFAIPSPEDKYEVRILIKNVVLHPKYNVKLSSWFEHGAKVSEYPGRPPVRQRHRGDGVQPRGGGQVQVPVLPRQDVAGLLPLSRPGLQLLDWHMGMVILLLCTSVMILSMFRSPDGAGLWTVTPALSL